MKKITLAQAAQLLKLAGVKNVELVKEDSEATPDIKVDDVLVELDAARKDVLKPQIEAELKPDIEKAIVGKISGTFRAALKRTFKAAGVVEKDFEGLETEEEMLKVALDKHNTTFSKDAEALRQEMQEMATKHSEALTLLERSKDEEYTKLKTVYTERDMREGLLGVVSKVPKLGGDPLFQTENYFAWLKQNYHLVLEEKDGKKFTKLRKLDNPELPAYNESGTAELTPDDLAPVYFEKVGAIVKDTRHINPQEAAFNGGGGGNGGAVKVNEGTQPVAPVQELNNAMEAYLNSDS